MEEKKYVYVVTRGINGVDDRREVRKFSDSESLNKLTLYYMSNLYREANIESQQIHYRNDKEFTQFDLQVEKVLLDEDGEYLESEVIFEYYTPKFRYGEKVD